VSNVSRFFDTFTVVCHNLPLQLCNIDQEQVMQYVCGSALLPPLSVVICSCDAADECMPLWALHAALMCTTASQIFSCQCSYLVPVGYGILIYLYVYFEQQLLC